MASAAAAPPPAVVPLRAKALERATASALAVERIWKAWMDEIKQSKSIDESLTVADKNASDPHYIIARQFISCNVDADTPLVDALAAIQQSAARVGDLPGYRLIRELMMPEWTEYLRLLFQDGEKYFSDNAHETINFKRSYKHRLTLNLLWNDVFKTYVRVEVEMRFPVLCGVKEHLNAIAASGNDIRKAEQAAARRSLMDAVTTLSVEQLTKIDDAMTTTFNDARTNFKTGYEFVADAQEQARHRIAECDAEISKIQNLIRSIDHTLIHTFTLSNRDQLNVAGSLKAHLSSVADKLAYLHTFFSGSVKQVSPNMDKMPDAAAEKVREKVKMYMIKSKEALDELIKPGDATLVRTLIKAVLKEKAQEMFFLTEPLNKDDPLTVACDQLVRLCYFLKCHSLVDVLNKLRSAAVAYDANNIMQEEKIFQAIVVHCSPLEEVKVAEMLNDIDSKRWTGYALLSSYITSQEARLNSWQFGTSWASEDLVAARAQTQSVYQMWLERRTHLMREIETENAQVHKSLSTAAGRITIHSKLSYPFNCDGTIHESKIRVLDDRLRPYEPPLDGKQASLQLRSKLADSKHAPNPASMRSITTNVLRLVVACHHHGLNSIIEKKLVEPDKKLTPQAIAKASTSALTSDTDSPSYMEE